MMFLLTDSYIRPLTTWVSGCLLDTLLLILEFGHPTYPFFVCIIQWDEKELDSLFTPNVYFWTPNSEILAKTLSFMYKKRRYF